MSGRPWQPPQTVRDLMDGVGTPDDGLSCRISLEDIKSSADAATLLRYAAQRLHDIAARFDQAADLLEGEVVL